MRLMFSVRDMTSPSDPGPERVFSASDDDLDSLRMMLLERFDNAVKALLSGGLVVEDEGEEDES
jgi:hypothetical protein